MKILGSVVKLLPAALFVCIVFYLYSEIQDTKVKLQQASDRFQDLNGLAQKVERIQQRAYKLNEAADKLERAVRVTEEVAKQARKRVVQNTEGKSVTIETPNDVKGPYTRVSVSFRDKSMPHFMDNAFVYEESDWIVIANENGERRYPKNTIKTVDTWE